jgi:PhnB protein
MKVNTFLNYGGNCAEAFRFYEKHLGGKIEMMMTRGEMPGQSESVAPESKNSILYASMTIGGTSIMGSDVPADRFQPMRSVYLSLGLDSDAEAERLFKLLAEGGEVFMPMQDTFFASRFAMLRDKFGTSWMIIHEKPMGRHKVRRGIE